MAAWHLLSADVGGGVAGYNELLAAALADAGREVHCWLPREYVGPYLLGVTRHAFAGMDPPSFRRMGEALDRLPGPRLLLVQYAPQAWGMKGMNVPFCRWVLSRRRKGDDVRVMFHEPFYPFGLQRPQRNLLAAVNRWMAWLLLRASTRAYVSTDAWKALLQPLAPPGLAFATLPIPSTIPFLADPLYVRLRREEITGGGDRPVFVHFGTYGGLIAPLLTRALQGLIARRPDARIVLLGMGGPEYADRLRAADARFADALHAPGTTSGEDISLHLQAADVAIQPYPDGADTRRTTLMACLANGVPTVTTRGRFTTGDVLLSVAGHAAAGEPQRVGVIAAEICADPESTRIGVFPELSLREATRAAYERYFAVEHTVARLLAEEDAR